MPHTALQCYLKWTSRITQKQFFEFANEKVTNSSKAAGLHLIIVCCQCGSDLHFVAWPKQFIRFCHYAWQYDLIFVLVQKSFHWCEMIKDSSVWNCWVLLAEVPLSLWATKHRALLFLSISFALLYGRLLYFLNATDCLSASELASHPSFSDGSLFKNSPHKLSPKLLCGLIKASWTNTQSALKSIFSRGILCIPDGNFPEVN